MRVEIPTWPVEPEAFETSREIEAYRQRESSPSGADALQALLAFSALHQQVRQRRALAARHKGFESAPPAPEFETQEQFVLDEVLQLVAERAIAITGADGLGIALAQNNEIVLRASAGAIKPDVGARIQRDSAFSGACFRTAQIIRCDDTETDDRVNLYACRQLGARSMVAVPLCGRRRVIGLLEAFSAEPFGFNDSDVTSLELLAELILGALKPEDEDLFAEAAEGAAEGLIAPPISSQLQPPVMPGASSELPGKALATSTDSAPAAVNATFLQDSGNSQKQSATASSATTTATLQPQVEPRVHVKLDDLYTTAEPLSPSSGHPGILLVLSLVVVAALLGVGLWWKLNNAQLRGTFLKPEPKMATKAATQTLAPLLPSQADASAPPNPQASGTEAETSKDPDSSSPSIAAAAAALPQELSKMPHITGIRHWSSADSSTIVLDLEDQVQYEAHRLANPDRIYFDLHDTSLPGDLDGKTIEIGDPMLARVRVAQPSAGLTRVVLETKGSSNFSVSLEPNPYRLVVQVRKPGGEAQTQVNLFPGTVESPKLAIVVPPPTKEDLQLRARVPKMRIVVDAGHGGWDLGTVGRRGLLEKDLVLEIAQRLGKLLETRLGADVILTRNDDNYIPLDERAGMANHSQADLFVSVHANYSDLPSARGVETYYTSFFSAPSAKDLETRGSTAAPGTSVLPASLSPSELHAKIEQSRRLAASVQRSLYGTLRRKTPVCATAA